MRPVAQLAAFAAALVVAFVAAFALGAAVGPQVGPTAPHGDVTPGVTAPAQTHAATH